MTAVPSAASCLVARAGCGAAAVVGPALPESSELPDAAVVAAAAFGVAAFEVAVFEVAVLGAEPSDMTGAVAPVVSVAAAAAVAPACVVAAAPMLGWAGAFVAAAVVVAAPDVGVAVAVAVAVVVAASPAVVVSVDDPGTAIADWLAAMAAAAIASGAVPLPPEAGVPPVAGVAVAATVTGRTTATGLGVAGLVPACGVGVEPLAEAADEVPPDDDVAVDCVESSLEVVDLVRERGGASVEPAWASEAGPLLGP